MEQAVSNNGVKSQEQFLINLQLEYLTQRLRALIYQDETYIRVASDIAAKKRMKINQLGIKFNLTTIFNGENVEQFVDKYFWNPNGLPNFQYKDAQQKRVQGNYDAWYMLYRGTIVVYKGKDAEVLSNNPAKEKLEIRINNDRKLTVRYSDITLNKNFVWI